MTNDNVRCPSWAVIIRIMQKILKVMNENKRIRTELSNQFYYTGISLPMNGTKDHMFLSDIMNDITLPTNDSFISENLVNHYKIYTHNKNIIEAKIEDLFKMPFKKHKIHLEGHSNNNFNKNELELLIGDYLRKDTIKDVIVTPKLDFSSYLNGIRHKATLFVQTLTEKYGKFECLGPIEMKRIDSEIRAEASRMSLQQNQARRKIVENIIQSTPHSSKMYVFMYILIYC